MLKRYYFLLALLAGAALQATESVVTATEKKQTLTIKEILAKETSDVSPAEAIALYELLKAENYFSDNTKRKEILKIEDTSESAIVTRLNRIPEENQDELLKNYFEQYRKMKDASVLLLLLGIVGIAGLMR